jgi:hypothetical protein
MSAATRTIDTGASTEGPSRLQVAIGCAMLAISLAGLAHAHFGLSWEINDQIFYGLVGGLTSWKLVK